MGVATLQPPVGIGDACPGGGLGRESILPSKQQTVHSNLVGPAGCLMRTFAERQTNGAPPFAVDHGQQLVLPPGISNPLAKKYSEKHTESHFVLGGPEQVSATDIQREGLVAAARHRHAGRTQLSSVVLTDEVRWPAAPSNRAHGGKATCSSVELTDQQPQREMPASQQGRAHVTGHAQPPLSPVYFGGAVTNEEAPQPKHGHGRAQVPSSRAQRSLVDAIVFGHQRGSYADAEASLAAAAHREGRRHLGGHASHMTEALSWHDDDNAGGGAGGKDERPRAAAAPYDRRYDAPYEAVHHERAQFGTGQEVPPARQVIPVRVPHNIASTAVPAPHLLPAHVSDKQNNQGANRAHAPPAVPAMDPVAGQLLYDQEKRQWVTRDGVPARFDPLLRGGAVVRQPGPPPLRFAPQAAVGGLRHPKLWMTTAQKAYGEAPMPQLPSVEERLPRQQPHRARGSAFTNAFAPPAPGGGFNM
jgi:hypothetical protein